MRYRRSYLSALKESEARATSKIRIDKRQRVRQLVPAIDFWLVERRKYLGLVQIRLKPSSAIAHILKSHIYYEIRPSMRRWGYGVIALTLAIKKATHLGLKRIIVVCQQNNIASRKIIESNGGVLLRAVRPRGCQSTFLKYRFLT